MTASRSHVVVSPPPRPHRSHRGLLVTAHALLAGVVCALVFPRGPQTGTASAAVMLCAVLLGLWCGWAWSRRRVYLTVLAAWAGCELARIPVRGPSVDLVSVQVLHGNTFALAALGFGRVVDGLLAALPLLTGMWLARSWQSPAGNTTSRPGRSVTRLAARICSGLVGSLLACLIVGLVIPARTPAIAGGFTRIVTFQAHGCRQVVLIRGARQDNPVIFFLSGGPGGTEVGSLGNQWRGVEDHFTVALWDQTGAGMNGHCFPRSGYLPLQRLIDDGLAAAEFVRRTLAQPVHLVGNSWGTFLGVLMVKQRPDLFASYVGSGQMAALTATDVMFWTDTIAWARTHGKADVANELLAQGPPPYADVYLYDQLFAWEGHWNAYPRDPRVRKAVNPLRNVWTAPELDLAHKLRLGANLVDTFASVYPQAADIDFRRDVTHLDVPVYLAAGVHEARGRDVPAREWFASLSAPRKEWVSFARSGHKAFVEEPEAFLALMLRVSSAGSR